MNVEQWLLETAASNRFSGSSDGYDCAILRCYTSSASSLDSLSIAKSNPMPSPVAPTKPRLSATLSRYTSNYRGLTPSELSSEQFDVWEHAALLYHGFEWEAAADTFVLLSQTIGNIESRMLCLLNAGMIRTRLGDYAMANGILREAAHVDGKFLLTPFFLGIVSFELGDHDQAEACFDLLLDELDNEAIDHSDVGLDFVVDRRLLRRNLQAVQVAQYAASFPDSNMVVTSHLDAVPADYIFEAPPRLRSRGAISEQECSTRDSSSPFTRFASKKMPGQNAGPHPPAAGHSSRSVSVPRSGHHGPLSIMSESPEDALGSESLSWARAPLSSSAPSSGTSQRRTWHRRPSTPYTPRDARAQYGSTRELAQFIRKADKDKPNLIPRDAKGEYESVRELASFIQLYAPENGHTATPMPLDLDPNLIVELRLERTLDCNYDAAAGSPISESSLSFDSSSSPIQFVGTAESVRRPSMVADTARFESPSDGQGHTSLLPVSESPLGRPTSSSLPQPLASKTEEITLEYLQPIAYKPGIPREVVRENTSDRDTVSSTHSKSRIVEMYAAAAASPSNSLCNGLPNSERKIKARKEALKALTGKSTSTLTSDDTNARQISRTEDIPPVDSKGHRRDSGETVDSPVDSMKFFNKVLGQRKTGQ